MDKLFELVGVKYPKSQPCKECQISCGWELVDNTWRCPETFWTFKDVWKFFWKFCPHCGKAAENIE